MASTHKHIRSSTANKRPTTAIADGQIALNTNSTSPGLFFKDSTGATIIKVGPVHVGSTAPNVTPPSGGSSGNSTGEVWLDTSLTPNGVKIWNGSSWTNATPIGSTTVQGLLELATSAETQAGSDTDRAVTPAGLQSKLSDSTSTTSSTTIASSTAVKAAYDLADAALPKSGGTVTGNLEIGTAGSLSFEGATADGFETTIAVVDPTADRTITLPDATGTVITTGDTGTVTGTMIASGTVTSTNIVDGTILNADINASAAIAGTKISPDFGSQNVTTTGMVTGGNFTATAQGDVRFADADSSNWVAFQAPTTVASNVTWTLPDADGTASQVLKTDGSGVLGWASVFTGAGGTITGPLEIGNTGSFSFEGSTDDGFETTLTVVDPTADRTITLPNATGTVSLLEQAQTFTAAQTFAADVTLNAQKDLRFADADSSNWVAFQAPATIASNVTWTLPATDGTSSQVLSTNGSGTLSWISSSIAAGGTVTGVLEIGNTGSFVFEGSTNDGFETTLTVVDPTADRTITLPNVTGTVITTGDTGTVTSNMIADGTIVNGDINASAAIADTKLATISTAGKVSNSATTATSANTASAIVARDASGNFSAGTVTASTFSGSGASLTSLPAGQLTGTVPSGVLGNSSLFVGTTSVALNRASANQALTGISSVALPGSTSGTVTLQPTATAGTTTITLPATTGTVITSGDSGTVTSTMIADGTIVNADINASAAIAHSKLANITAGQVLLGNASNVPTATALSGDVTINSTGVTAIGSGVIVNADVNASAAIAGTKISPDFGSQNIVTTGTITGTSVRGGITSGTAVTSASGTAVEFTGIPSWAKRVTLMFSGLSTNGTSIIQIQLGTSSGFTTSGYAGSVDTTGNAVNAITFGTGLGLTRAGGQAAAYALNGTATFTNLTSNTWTGTQLNGTLSNPQMSFGACSIALSGTLDRIRLTTVNNTDAFDAGSINIMYEG